MITLTIVLWLLAAKHPECCDESHRQQIPCETIRVDHVYHQNRHVVYFVWLPSFPKPLPSVHILKPLPSPDEHCYVCPDQANWWCLFMPDAMS
jgi:hypothetical protein